MTDRIFNITTLRTLVLIAGCVVIGQSLTLITSYAMPIAFLLLTAAATAFFFLPMSALVPLYFAYLICDGGLKILTNYNPVIHVASDLVLLAIFWRLFQRKRADPTVGTHSEEVNNDLRTAVVFFSVYWVWVAIQFINPLNLGILPSLAGLKLHLIPYLCFFVVCFFITKEEARTIPFVMLGLTFMEAVIAIIDWSQGVEFIGRLSYNYVETYVTFLQGYPYRPFGTTALPGQPSVWIANGMVALFVVHFTIRQMTPEQIAKAKSWYRFRGLIWLYIPVAILGLVTCQVRVALIRTLLVCTFGICLQGRKQTMAVFLFIAAVFSWNLLLPPPPAVVIPPKGAGAIVRLEVAVNRFRTLQSKDTFVKARGGSWALEEIFRRASVNSMGFGLSRNSASAAPWGNLIKLDQYFPQDYVFADNLLLAVFTELGFFGMLSYIAMFGAFIVILLRRENPIARFVAIALAMAFASGYASEGLLYQPEASVLWTFLGIGMRAEGVT